VEEEKPEEKMKEGEKIWARARKRKVIWARVRRIEMYLDQGKKKKYIYGLG
jgi:flavin-binding protein dodecin